jgi:hypothetical protein
MLSRVALCAVANCTPFSVRGFSAIATRPGAETSATLEPAKHTPTSPTEYVRFNPSDYFTNTEDKKLRADLQRIKALEDEAIAAVTQDTPDVDWDAWRAQIRYPGLVDELKVAYDAIPVPNVEAERERLTKAVEDKFNPLLQKIKMLALDSEASSKHLEKRLEEVTYLHDNIENLTVDEFLEKYPAVKASIEDDIKNDRWFVQ